MTDWLPETPVMTRPYCPACEPDRDALTELLEVRYCEPHAPRRGGADDPAVIAATYLSGSAEAGGEDNRVWCALFHRKEPPC